MHWWSYNPKNGLSTASPLLWFFELSAIALQIMNTDATQEFIRQSHDLIQKFSWDQISPR